MFSNRAGAAMSRHRVTVRFLALFICLMLSGVVTAEAAQAVRDFERTLPLTGSSVSVNNRFGNVDVSTHRSSDVHVKATIRVSASKQDLVDELMNGIRIVAESGAAGVTVRTEFPEQKSTAGRRSVSFTVSYELAVPERARVSIENRFGSVKASGLRAPSSITNGHGGLLFRSGRGNHTLTNSFGGIDVEDNQGDLNVTNSHGPVTVRKVNGTVNVTNRFGPVEASGITRGITVANSNSKVEVVDSSGEVTIANSFGPVGVARIRGNVTVANRNGTVEVRNAQDADLASSFGSIDFSDLGSVKVNGRNSKVTGRNVGGSATVETSFGSVNLAGVSGETKISNQNGDVTVDDLKRGATIDTRFGLVKADRVSGTLTVENANGGVNATAISGATKVKTSFGPVFLSGIGGEVTVENQNGAIELSGVSPGKCTNIALKTSFGSILADVPQAPGYALTARTSYGRITSSLPVTAQGEISNNVLRGKIGQGSCVLDLQNQNGNIQIGRGE